MAVVVHGDTESATLSFRRAVTFNGHCYAMLLPHSKFDGPPPTPIRLTINLCVHGNCSKAGSALLLYVRWYLVSFMHFTSIRLLWFLFWFILGSSNAKTKAVDSLNSETENHSLSKN